MSYKTYVGNTIVGGNALTDPFDYSSDSYYSPDLWSNPADVAWVPPQSDTIQLVDQQGDWYLYCQITTQYRKWVSKAALESDSLDIAFYDADPTFKPPHHE
jgi:hypothetical protein